MRRILLLLLGCVLVTGCAEAVSPRAAVPMTAIDDGTTEKETTGELDAFGTWSDDPTYGQVWTPNDDSFVPYETGGEWVMLGDETTFVSDVAWVQPTYKRGRWIARPTVDGTRWSWAPHGRPTTVMPAADVATRAFRPDPLRVLDVANVESRLRAEENAARMSEPRLLAMHGSSHFADAAHESHPFGNAHVTSHFSSHVSSHFSSGHVGHAHSRGHR